MILTFAGNDGLDAVELVQGFERGQVVDIKMKNLVTDLAKHRVFKLEETELDSVLSLRFWLVRYSLLAVLVF